VANDNVPFIAIIGGFWDMPRSRFEEATRLAKELGAALAAAGCGLVVYHSNQESLEPHVVAGYVSAMGGRAVPGLIRVRFAESQRDTVRFNEQASNGDLFEPKLFPGNDWEAPFYRSLAAAEGVDGVLLMAGARSTLIAGQIAVARHLPVLAIDAFGGAAGVIWTELAGQHPDYLSSTTNSPKSLIEWLKAKCVLRIQQRVEARRREVAYAGLSSQARRSRWTALAFVLLLTAVFFGMVRVPSADYYVAITVTGLIASGATGALVRSVISTSENTGPGTSFLLGSIAGFVVGLAYLIPQFVGAPGVLDPASDTVTATDKIQFVSAALVALSAGVGFDTVFTRLRQDAATHRIGPGDTRA
jgi:hypothetical protein